MEVTIAAPMSGIAPPLAIYRTRTSAAHPLGVLLVEDNPEGADLIQAYLAGDPDHGYHVEWMSNLRDAMFRLEQSGIDVVLLDLGLPELSGHKSYRATEGMTNGWIPIVILTADDRPISRDLTMAAGAADYLIKQHSTGQQIREALHNAVLKSNSKRGN